MSAVPWRSTCGKGKSVFGRTLPAAKCGQCYGEPDEDRSLVSDIYHHSIQRVAKQTELQEMSRK